MTTSSPGTDKPSVSRTTNRLRVKEPLTLLLMLGCYLAWFALTLVTGWGQWIAVPLLVLLTTLQSSLQHEALHGHPTSSKRVNEAIVGLPVGLFIPYRRFKDQHLAHHQDETLTDPYDDPESNFLTAARWRQLPRPVQILLAVNNVLLGRMVLGPAIALGVFYWQDVKALLAGNRAVRLAYVAHLIGLAPVLYWIIAESAFSWPMHMAIAYAGLSLLRIRTFLEHRAAVNAKARTVIINDRGPLAFLFLNNNFHAVHHANPTVAWFRLPALFDQHRNRVLEANDGYFYPSYWTVIRRHLLQTKDPVAHPFMRR